LEALDQLKLSRSGDGDEEELFELIIDRCDLKLESCNKDEAEYTKFLKSFYINIMD
jgi:hypothetical protein